MRAEEDSDIDHILRAEKETEAKAAAPKTVDPTQQAVAEELKNALRRGTLERDATKAAIRYLGQPMGRFAIKRLKAAYADWGQDHNDGALLMAVQSLAADFGKEPTDPASRETTLTRDNLELICFEYVSC